MSKTDFSSLAFFSKHFNVPEDKLRWCILEKVENSDYHQFLIGIAIENSKSVISVQECCLRRLERGKLKLHAATLQEKKKRFYLKSEKPIYGKEFCEFIFSRKNLTYWYSDKWYEDETK